MSRNRPPATVGRAPGALLAAALAAVGLFAVGLPATVRADAVSGATLFGNRCSVCHGAQAAGIPGAFPSLHEQVVAFGKSAEGRDYLIMVVTTGLMGDITVAGVTYRGVMPAQSGLSEAEVAAVLSFLAGGMNPAGGTDVIKAQDVLDARARHPDRAAQATRALRPAFPER